MGSFDHKPAEPAEPENMEFAAVRARYGLILFAVYLLLYGGFMLLTAFVPAVMASEVFGGVNLAIVYGLGLIGAALVLALVYAWLCRASAARFQSPGLSSGTNAADASGRRGS